MTPALARRIALATLDPVMFDIIYDTAYCVAAGRPVQIDYGFTTAEVEASRTDRAVLAGVYREVSARQDFVTATLIARLGWLAGLAADGDDAADRRRLDWLAEHTWGVKVNNRGTKWVVEIRSADVDLQFANGPTLREAIDAAMSGWAARETPDA
jgi:hypothetical protein